MPRLDKTGPEGKGSKTGRVLGRCRTSNRIEEEEGWNLFGRRKGRGSHFSERRNRGSIRTDSSAK